MSVSVPWNSSLTSERAGGRRRSPSNARPFAKFRRTLVDTNLRVFVLAECPSMTLTTSDGTTCPQNGDIVIKEPSTMTFTCTYETQGRQTAYSWFVDGTQVAGLTSSTADISIESGSHRVTCEANIDVSDLVPPNAADDCNCFESSTLNVTVVGMRST